MRVRASALLATLLVAAPVRAHLGALPSTVVFTAPAAPTALRADGGISVAPYTFAQADAFFDVRWTVELPNDPTGRFSFYYLDYIPPSAVTYDQIPTIATAIPEASGDNAIWVSCACDDDAGVVCPDAGSRVGKCSLTQFRWNTAALASGVYWLIALNNDPPYRIYTTSGGPVRVAHGGAALPPASAIVLPDGLFAADLGFRTLWISTGQAPLHFNLFYGVDDAIHALDTPKPLGTDVTPIQNADATLSYDWDISTYVDGLYYFGVEVSDATGQRSTTNSRYGQNVYHPPRDGGPIQVDEDSEGGAPDAQADATSVGDAELPMSSDASSDLQSDSNDGSAPNDATSTGSSPSQSGGCGCQTSGPATPAGAIAIGVAVVAMLTRRRRLSNPRIRGHASSQIENTHSP